MSAMRRVIPAVVLLAVLGACTAGESPIVEASRDCGDFYGTEVCAWSETQGDSLVAAGLDVPIAAIENAPDSVPMSWPPVAAVVLRYPEQVVRQGGLQEFTMSWELQGHGPQAYLTPHFDFHFYLAGTQPRGAITCSDTTKMAAPPGYAVIDEELPPEVAAMLGTDRLVGICIPEMGMHAIPEADLAGAPWTGSMIVGSYGGLPLFLEPMVTRARLLERASFSYPIPEIAGLADPHPRSFSAEWNAETSTYRFRFSDFMPAVE